MENLLIDTEYPYGCDTYTIEQIKSELHLVKLCEIYSSDIDREKDNYKKFTETIANSEPKRSVRRSRTAAMRSRAAIL